MATELRLRLGAVAASARDYAGQAKAANTLRASRADWADCTAWCDRYTLPPLPAAPETVALYLAALADSGRKASTLQRRLSAISQAHQAAGHPTPTRDSVVRRTWGGIRRAIGTAQAGKDPLVTEELRRLIAALPPPPGRARPRPPAGRLRRRLPPLGLVGLDLADVRCERDGLVVTLRHSKTDQEGEGRRVGLPFGSRPETCPVRALQDWLAAGGIQTGPPLPRGRPPRARRGRPPLRPRGGAGGAARRRGRRAGPDARRRPLPPQRAGHRRGAGGVRERAIMAQTGHRARTMVRRYIREGSLFRDNAAAAVGL